MSEDQPIIQEAPAGGGPFDFSEALRRMKRGAIVSREAYSHQTRIFVDGTRSIRQTYRIGDTQRTGLWCPHPLDLLAEDWIEIE